MINNSLIKNYLIVFVCILFSYGCEQNETSPQVDVSAIKVELKIHRFDQTLFAIQPDSIQSNIPLLEKKFGNFFNLFCAKIINIGGTNYRNFASLLQRYVSDYNMLTVFSDCQKTFNNISDLTNGLTGGFKFYKYYFPDKNIPEIYFYMGGFNQSIVTSENILGIGLDKYLGKKYPFYSRLGLSTYQCYKMQKEFILPDCFRAIAWSEFSYKDSVNDLIHNMIYQGKIQYFINAMLPEIADTIKFGYTKSQWDWCLQNEKSMWSYLIDKKKLFITSEKEIKHYINDAPFTSFFSHQSPGRTGVWLGWRIVNKYMKKHPKITLEEMMLDNDYEKILNGSKYNP